MLQWFVDQVNRERTPGGSFKPVAMGRMARMLQGLELRDLYYMQSVFRDTERRRGYTAAVKEWWWSIRAPKQPEA